MPKNKIPLCAFVGVNLVAVGLFIFSIGISISESIQGASISLEDTLGLSIAALLGTGIFLSGIGLIMRKKWARIILNIVLFILIAFFAIGLFFFVTEGIRHIYWRHLISQFSVLICIAAFLAGIFLFINNRKVIDSLGKKELEEEV